ncbi:hypothetical protein [Novosphingobium kaempferiae]|uniref:hypothetical protein n=1 Tax=Novosphingobium kaempferiae TaxID=2896849 RepID=UPI001E28F7E0|nr:hypothetical protein [Novosphingobium kaempferiae]
MDGVALLVTLLIETDGVTDLVPAPQIMAGVLPQNTPLDAISITSVSRVDHHPLAKGPTALVRERVQVSILAQTYERQKAIHRAVLRAVTAIQRPEFWAQVPDWYAYLFGPTIRQVTVLTDAAGPDFMLDEANIYMGTQDYRVTYNEER